MHYLSRLLSKSVFQETATHIAIHNLMLCGNLSRFALGAGILRCEAETQSRRVLSSPDGDRRACVNFDPATAQFSPHPKHIRDCTAAHIISQKIKKAALSSDLVCK